MNILYFANPIDVLDRKCYEYFNQINGIRVFLLCDEETFKQINPLQLKKIKEEGVIILPPITPFTLKFFPKVLFTIKKINGRIRKNKIDIVHVLYSCPNALWLNYLNGVKKIITTYGSDILITIPRLQKGRGIAVIRNRILYSLLKKSYNNADFITCTSWKQKEKIFEFASRKAELIRNGINIKQLLQTQKNENLPCIIFKKKYILFPRSMAPVYNHELEVDAIKLLNPELLKEIRFIFLKGANSDLTYTQKIKNSLKKIPGLDFMIMDYIIPENIFFLIKNASLVVMVPHSDGTPNSALEAMVYKVPLVLGTMDYDKDIFDKSCLKLSENNPEELARLMTEALVSYPEVILERGFNMVQENADWNIEMNKMLEVYNKSLKS